MKITCNSFIKNADCIPQNCFLSLSLSFLPLNVWYLESFEHNFTHALLYFLLKNLNKFLLLTWSHCNLGQCYNDVKCGCIYRPVKHWIKTLSRVLDTLLFNNKVDLLFSISASLFSINHNLLWFPLLGHLLFIYLSCIVKSFKMPQKVIKFCSMISKRVATRHAYKTHVTFV